MLRKAKPFVCCTNEKVLLYGKKSLDNKNEKIIGTFTNIESKRWIYKIHSEKNQNLYQLEKSTLYALLVNHIFKLI